MQQEKARPLAANSANTWMLITSVIGLLVSITLLIRLETRAHRDGLSALQTEVTDARIVAEGLKKDINYTIYRIAPGPLDETGRRRRDELTTQWSVDNDDLKNRIKSYTALEGSLEKGTLSWADDVYRLRSKLITDRGKDKSLRNDFDRNKQDLAALLASHSQGVASASDSKVAPPEDALIALVEPERPLRQRSFRKVDGKWLEYPQYAPGLHFEFEERARDDQYVYLEDASRARDGDTRYPMLVRLPIRGGMAQWSYEESSWLDLFDVGPVGE